MASRSGPARFGEQAARARASRPRPAAPPAPLSARRPPTSSPPGTAAGRAVRPRRPTRCHAPRRTPAHSRRPGPTEPADARRCRHSDSTRSAATSSSTVPPSGAERIANFLSPARRSSTSPPRATRKESGMTRPGDHRLAQTPARFDHALVRAGDRVAREHHTGRLRLQQRLHDHADARPGEHTEPLAVGDGRVGVGRPPDLPDRRLHVVGRRHVQDGDVLSGEAGPGAVLADGGRPHGQGRRQRVARRRRSAAVASASPDAIASTAGPGRATPGGTGSPARSASPSPTAFAPYSSSLSASTSGTMPLTRGPSPCPRHRRPGRGCRRRSARWRRGCRRHRGCRTPAR